MKRAANNLSPLSNFGKRGCISVSINILLAYSPKQLLIRCFRIASFVMSEFHARTRGTGKPQRTQRERYFVFKLCVLENRSPFRSRIGDGFD